MKVIIDYIYTFFKYETHRSGFYKCLTCTVSLTVMRSTEELREKVVG